jgi:hypothetical protein
VSISKSATILCDLSFLFAPLRERTVSRKGAKKGRRRKEFALTESLSFEIAAKCLEISKGPFTNLPRS